MNRYFSIALVGVGLAGSIAHALLPPVEVECCQRRDSPPAQCANFKLDEASCANAQAKWAETYRRWQETMNANAAKGAAAAAASAPKDTAGEGDLTIDRVEARLYHQHSGTFSAPITPQTRFWNVIIGEGGAKEPSSTLRVDVVLKGKPGGFKEKAKINVEFIDTETGKRIGAQSAMAGVLSPRGFYHTLFMLHPAGCIPLKINAQLSGAGNPAPVRSIEVPFSCGE